MTIEEAKFTLSGYRPGLDRAEEPAVTDALRLAAADAGLGRWLAQTQAFDQVLSRKLKEILPPPGLRDAIMAGARAGQTRKRPMPTWGWLAVAAAVAIGVFFLPGRAKLPPESAQLGHTAINDMATAEHDSHGPAVDALIGRLQTKAPMPGGDEIDFDGLRETGCRRINFEGHDLLEVCFDRNGSKFHFYVARRQGRFEEPASRRPGYLTEKDGFAAVWSDDSFVYALATRAGSAALHRILK